MEFQRKFKPVQNTIFAWATTMSVLDVILFFLKTVSLCPQNIIVQWQFHLYKDISSLQLILKLIVHLIWEKLHLCQA